MQKSNFILDAIRAYNIETIVLLPYTIQKLKIAVVNNTFLHVFTDFKKDEP